MTWLVGKIHFEVFFAEIDPDLLSYGPAFFKRGSTSSVTIRIFKSLKWELQKGNRRLILNTVTKIGRMMEVQKSCVNARTDISAAFHRGAFHESEPSSSRIPNKIAAVLYQLSYEDPHSSSKPIYFFFLIG